MFIFHIESNLVKKTCYFPREVINKWLGDDNYRYTIDSMVSKLVSQVNT